MKCWTLSRESSLSRNWMDAQLETLSYCLGKLWISRGKGLIFRLTILVKFNKTSCRTKSLNLLKKQSILNLKKTSDSKGMEAQLDNLLYGLVKLGNSYLLHRIIDNFVSPVWPIWY